MGGRSFIGRAFDFVSSVKTAIPLLVVIAAASILGAIIPQGRNVRLAAEAPGWLQSLNRYLQLNNIFYSWWYLTLLALLALCLLAVTVKRVPIVWRVRGRGPALAILMAHLGVILLVSGMIYGGLAGVRYYTRLIEGDATVLPQLPFIIKLERLEVDYYSAETFNQQGTDSRMASRQDSTLTLFHHGEPFLTATAAPGNPLSARGITLLPSQKEVGWAFDLVLKAGGREKVVPIRPWAPPLITLGLGNSSRVMTHRLVSQGQRAIGFGEIPADAAAEVFLLQENGASRSLGFATRAKPLEFGAWEISLGGIRRYTGLHVYSRPEVPVLMLGVAALVAGLIGYVTRWGQRLLPYLRRGPLKSQDRTGRETAPTASGEGVSHVAHSGGN